MPDGTKSFAVTCLDPDAPTGNGFWHWGVFNIPASVTELAAGRRRRRRHGCPDGAVQIRSDANVPGYVGAGPPPGPVAPLRLRGARPRLDATGPDAGASPAFAGFLMFGHVLARGMLTGTYER